MEIYNENLGIYLRDLYPKGTIGNNLFPDALEDRRRRIDLLQDPIPVIVLDDSTSRRLDRKLSVNNFEGLLRMPREELRSFLRPKRLAPVESQIVEFIRDKILFSPDDRLMSAIFGARDWIDKLLISPVKEPERHKVIEDALGNLQRVDRDKLKRSRVVLEMRFGLIDWMPRTRKETAGYFEITEERIRQIEAHALRVLRYPPNSRNLLPYLPVES